MKTPAFVARLTLGSLLSAFLIGCPDVPAADPLLPPPSVIAFTASQAAVAPGGSVTLTWNVENASEVKIDELKLGAISGVSGNSGTVEVAITEDALFVLTARNERGVSDTAVVQVRTTVTTTTELLFAALPTVISAGERVTLAWGAPAGSTVTLTAAPGGAIDLGGQGISGSVIVTPSESTTYTLSAGGRTAVAMITVRPTLLSFTASSLAVDAGAQVTLSWTTAGASRVRLVAPGRANLVDEADPAKVASGSYTDTLPTTVDPGQVFPYQLTVTGGTTTLTDSLVVTIKGNPAILTFTAPKYASRASDAGVLLTWTTREADSLSILSNDAELYRAPSTSLAAGSLRIPTPANDSTIKIAIANARGGEASQTAMVDVVSPPTISLNASVASINIGDPVSLSWAGTDVRNVRILDPNGAILFAATDTTDTGSVPGTFSYTTTTTLRIEVDNGAGDAASATRTITVNDTFQFTPPATGIRAGERTRIAWTPANFELTGLPHEDIVVRAGSADFDDIATTGTRITFADGDAATRVVPPGFSAPFYGRFVGSELWVSADGYASFSPIGNNTFVPAALPSSRIEPYSIAPCWYDITGTPSAYWQVKDVPGGGKVLIVQWNESTQFKLFSSGQLEFEYLTNVAFCTTRGVRGPFGDDGLRVTGGPASGTTTGVTFFGPKVTPVELTYRHEQTIAATVNFAGRPAPVTGPAFAVVQTNELSISEAMVFPLAAVGPAARWFELYNSTQAPIDLTGWTIGVTDGGVPSPLSGVVPARGVIVIGASTDPAVNDDAGVTLAWTGAFPAQDAGTIALARDGGHATFSWTNATPGVSITRDFGPYTFSTDTSSAVPRPQTCATAETFGSQPTRQRGTPGIAANCGFPFTWQEIPAGYFDISTTGTKATLSSNDDSAFRLSMAAAPFTYFGEQKTEVNICTNGWVAFDGSITDQLVTTVYPVDTDVNAMLAIFAADLIGTGTGFGIYTQRVGQGVDPAAAAPHWIIQWTKWTHFATYDDDIYSDYADDLNFQIKLFDDGVIEYHFGKMLSGSSPRNGTGITTSTWLEDPTGTQALIINARSYTPGISPNTAFRFSPR